MNLLRRRWGVTAVLCFACLAAGPTPAQAKVDWNPKKTWVFVVGILEWERADLWSPFPAAVKDRRDEQLVQLFRAAGVPAEKIVCLQDAQATKARIEKKLGELLDATSEGDLLVFYFAGHGSRNRASGETYLANYDGADAWSSYWSVRSVFQQIESRFSGDRVLLAADCCHSGALFEQARKAARDGSEIGYAVLTSSSSHNTSTGAWTFSDCLLAGLRGEGAVDLDGDQAVELEEIARYAELEMAFMHGQKSMFTASEGFGGGAKLAEVRKAALPRAGQRIEVLWKGKWFKAKSLAAEGDRLKVHYVGFQDAWDEWVSPDRVRPYQPAQYAAGDAVEVLWKDGVWYPARVLRGTYGVHLVRYDGYDASADEWVSPQQIRLPTEAGKP